MPKMPSSHVKAAAPRVKGSFKMRAVNQAPAGTASGSKGGKPWAGTKRKQPAEHSDDDDDVGDEADVDEESSAAEEDEESNDTDDEIAASQAGKSKKTAKRKRRATSPTSFGAALSGLLGGEVNEAGDAQDGVEAHAQQSLHKSQQPTILSLAPHIRRSVQSSRLNQKAARLALEARRKREDRAHVTDVIGGWGAPGQPPKTLTGDSKTAQEDLRDDDEKIQGWLHQGGVQGYEKRLRKAAQRGVVKLFNAIRAAQNTNEDDLAESQQHPASSKSSRQGLGDTSAAAPDTSNVSLKKGENALGGKLRAVNELSKGNFFDLLRAGSTGQRA